MKMIVVHAVGKDCSIFVHQYLAWRIYMTRHRCNRLWTHTMYEYVYTDCICEQPVSNAVRVQFVTFAGCPDALLGEDAYYICRCGIYLQPQ